MTSSTDMIAKFEAAFEAFETTDERRTDLYVTQIYDAIAKIFYPIRYDSVGAEDLGCSIINLCHIQIGRALVGRFEGFEHCLEFRDDVGQRRHRYSVLLATTGSRWELFRILISTIEEH